MKLLLLVFTGGGLGSVCRYLLQQWIPASQFPWSTWLVNVLGSCLIGYLVSVTQSSASQTGTLSTMALLSTGFCGGFTTFSAFSKESLLMLQQQQTLLFVLYVSGSLFCCLMACAFGYWLGR